MSYVCKNLECTAPENKRSKEYLYAMECPFCDVALTEIISLSESEIKLINSLPYVIAYPLRKTLSEKHNWTKINLFKDTFLNYMKYLGLVIASEFFNSQLKDKRMVALFQSALSEPSFGSWNQYIRETVEYLKKENHMFFCPELVTHYENIETKKGRKLYKGEIQYIDSNGDILLKKQEASAIGMLINFRNRYLGHGLTLDENSSQILWDQYFPIFKYLLDEMKFSENYPMFKHDHGETYLLNSADLRIVDKDTQSSGRVWLENVNGQSMNILPFFVVPGEVLISKEEKEQILAYESYTGKTIKFFSPEGTERHTSGKILEKLNLLLRDKLKEVPYTPLTFKKDIFLSRIAEENKIIKDGLIAEKKVIPDLYIHRQEMEIKLKEWIGAKSNIFFIAAEAGSGKTNLLVEIEKEYTKRNLPTLLIRAGRIDKKTLKEHICYVLNISTEFELQKYSFLQGSQSVPTIILIDGLNEAGNVENIWEEIIELSETYESGCLKFVISYRANNKKDLDRLKIRDKQHKLIYSTNKDNEADKGIFAHWLTAMNREETNCAWEAYRTNDKNKYNPNFSFNELAFFDRSIYDQISNPLILKLFLETYNKKSLKKKSLKYLNIWQDWFEIFSTDEKIFLKILAEQIWEKGENELLLDDLLKKEHFKPYLKNDLINAPYPKLKNMGWLSYYVKDLNMYIGFTVEGILIYIMGKRLEESKPLFDLEKIKSLIQNGTKLQNAAIESYLGELALKKDLELIVSLIDSGTDKIDICIKPLFLYTKALGIDETFKKLIENPTENDWNVLSKLYDYFDVLQLLEYKKQFADLLYTYLAENKLKLPVKISIDILTELSYPKNEIISDLIENEIKKMNHNDAQARKLYDALAFYYSMNGYPEKGIKIYNDIYSEIDKIDDPIILNKIGAAYNNVGDKDNAILYFEAAKEKLFKQSVFDNELAGMIYFNLAHYKDESSEKFHYYEKALEYEIREYGRNHISTSMTLCGIALAEIEIGQFNEALNNLNEAYNIINELGGDKKEIFSWYGYYYEKIEDFKKAINYYEKSFETNLLKYGTNGLSLIKELTSIARIYEKLGDDHKSLEFFIKADHLLNNYDNKNLDDIFYVKGMLGYLNFHLSKYNDSILHFNESIANHLSNKSSYTSKQINTIYYYLSYSYYHLSDFENAINAMKNIENLTIKEINRESFIDNNELLGNIHFYLSNYHLAIKYYSKITPLLEDEVKRLEIIELIATCYEHLNEYSHAIKYYEDCTSLGKSIEILGDISKYYFRIAVCFENTKEYANAVSILKEGYDLYKKSYFLEFIAKCYEMNNDKIESLNYHIQHAEMMKTNPEEGITYTRIQESINNTKRLAKELDRENDLPEWFNKI